MQEQGTTDTLTPKPTTDQLGTPPIIEGDIAASEITGTVPLAPPKREFHFNYWLLIAAILVVILASEHVPALLTYIQTTYFHRQATVTLFSTQKQVAHTYTFLAVTGTPDAEQQQVPSRLISSTSPAQTVTLQATGTAQTQPTNAYGIVTFYNDAPYAQTIDAGTVITGNDGIQIVTDQAVTIAAGTGATNGSISVPAHTLQAGTQANISRYDVNRLCCISGMRAINASDFTGGKDPISYTVVSSTDIAAAQKKAASSLDPQAKGAITAQVKPTEKELTALQCSFTTQATPKVGEKATATTVSVAESCDMQVYDHALLQTKASSQFLQDIAHTLGTGFLPKHDLSVSLTKTRLVDQSHHTYTLLVSVSATLLYRPTPQQVQRLTTLIAGKSLTQARTQLLHMQGIAGVYIQPVHQNDGTLPADPTQIDIIVS
jgi:hypothetical protein